MKKMKAGIMPAGRAMKGISWNILGQIYTPKQLSRKVVFLACRSAPWNFCAAAYSPQAG